jgi:hypothetical protein
MFRKISENIISAAVSPFSSAPSTPAVTDSPSTPDITSLSITSSSASTSENTHQARAKVERQLADDLARFGVPMSTEDCSGCDDHEEGCEESDGAGHVTHVQYPRGFDVDWDSDLLASAKPQPRQVSATLILSGFGYPEGSLAKSDMCLPACLLRHSWSSPPDDRIGLTTTQRMKQPFPIISTTHS